MMRLILAAVAGIAAVSAGTPDCARYAELHGCPKNLQPVCGSNLRIYNNECLLCEEMRVNKLMLQIVDMRECTVAYQQLASIPEGHRLVKCPATKPQLCPKIYQPVCTHSGEQFANECDMCQQKFSDLSMDPIYVRDGECTAVKFAQQSSVPEGHRPANCPTTKPDLCPKIYQPVCTHTGEQFPNECDMCRQKFYDLSMDPIYVKDGACDTKRNSAAAVVLVGETAPACYKYERMAGCPRNLQPVCGSDLNVYSNECVLCQEMKENKLFLHIVPMDECQPVAALSVQSSEVPRCGKYVKMAGCPKDLKPVCGSNLKVYNNECLMCQEMRVNKLLLHKVAMEECV